jgi:HlyD family secretion protein
MTSPRKTAARSPRRFLLPVIVLAVLGGLGYWWFGRGEEAPGFRTAKIEEGDIRVTISATGTLNALSTVDVGSEVSGKVAEVLVDFNEVVERGQLIARIDPSTFQAQIAQSDASIASARASLDTARATLRNAEADYARKRELAEQKLVSRGELDLALSARDQARAQVASAEARVRQELASSDTARLNLERTAIRSPVDGVVLNRAVEPGQTVAASLQAPVLFKIAEDLVRMEIVLSVDESDIGQVKQGQGVSFTVDAFPDRQFRGDVRQIRLSATNTNNVITYPVVVAVSNADQALLPGMTVNAEIEVSRREGILKVPNAALRFKPPEDPAAQGGPAAAAVAAARAGRSGLSEELPKVAAGLKLNPAQQAAFDAALAEMRERAAARVAPPPGAGGGGGGSSLFGRFPGGGSGGPPGGGNLSGQMRQRMLERFNQQFAAFRGSLDDAQRQRWDSELNALIGARRAPVYRLVDGKPEPTTVRIGASDGSSTEIVGDVKAGDEVVIGTQAVEQKS